MKELSTTKVSSYDLRNKTSFLRRRLISVWHGIESVSNLGPRIWELVPNEIKQSESLNALQIQNQKVGHWKIYMQIMQSISLEKWGLYLHKNTSFNK